MRLRPFCLAVLLLFTPTSDVQAETWYILPGGSGDAPTIQAGIDSALDGDVVLLAAGVYSGPGNRDVVFGGKAIIVTSESGAASTIIDCGGAGRGFSFENGEGPASILSDVTITNGAVGLTEMYRGEEPDAEQLLGGMSESNFGGGIEIVSGSPTIRDNVVTNCTAGAGGGIYCGPGTSPLIDGNRIEGGTGQLGGGILCMAGSSAKLTDNEIRGNQAFQGGGIWCSAGFDCEISGNQIVDNTSQYYGGGIYVAADAAPIVDSNRIEGNFAENGSHYTGAGMHCASGSSPTIVGNTFFNNRFSTTSDPFPAGGGIAAFQASVLIVGNTFAYNGGEVSSDGGLGGGVMVFHGSAQIRNNVFYGNEADQGSGVFIYNYGVHDVVVTIEHNLFYENLGWEGGTLYVTTEDDVLVKNCTLSHNSAVSTVFTPCAGLSVSAWEGCQVTVENTIVSFSTSGVGIRYAIRTVFVCCDVFGNAGGDGWGEGTDGGGNISLDPLYCDAEGADFTLDSSSPCAAENNDCSAYMGALPVGCGPVSVEIHSWGRIKALMREQPSQEKEKR